jgi:hypothetical protein
MFICLRNKIVPCPSEAKEGKEPEIDRKKTGKSRKKEEKENGKRDGKRTQKNDA